MARKWSFPLLLTTGGSGLTPAQIAALNTDATRGESLGVLDPATASTTLVSQSARDFFFNSADGNAIYEATAPGQQVSQFTKVQTGVPKVVYQETTASATRFLAAAGTTGVLARTDANAVVVEMLTGAAIGAEYWIGRIGANDADFYVGTGLIEAIYTRDSTTGTWSADTDGGIRLNENGDGLIKKISTTRWELLIWKRTDGAATTAATSGTTTGTGLPAGGTIGQVLVKSSSTNGDAAWTTFAAPTGAYEHTQAVPALVWTITHNLGFRPNIQVLDATGALIGSPEIAHTSVNAATFTSETAITGTARCN